MCPLAKWPWGFMTCSFCKSKIITITAHHLLILLERASISSVIIQLQLLPQTPFQTPGYRIGWKVCASILTHLTGTQSQEATCLVLIEKGWQPSHFRREGDCFSPPTLQGGTRWPCNEANKVPDNSSWCQPSQFQSPLPFHSRPSWAWRYWQLAKTAERWVARERGFPLGQLTPLWGTSRQIPNKNCMAAYCWFTSTNGWITPRQDANFQTIFFTKGWKTWDRKKPIITRPSEWQTLLTFIHKENFHD